jgi:hypothetical protein
MTHVPTYYLEPAPAGVGVDRGAARALGPGPTVDPTQATSRAGATGAGCRRPATPPLPLRLNAKRDG